MTLTNFIKYGVIPGLLVAMVSCGSGSGGGMTGSGLVIGPITGLGSIIVNDVTFDVDRGVTRAGTAPKVMTATRVAAMAAATRRFAARPTIRRRRPRTNA